MAELRELLHEAQARLAAAGVAHARADAEALLLAALGRPRAFLYAHPEAKAAAREQEEFARLITARAAGQPLQYLLGRQNFFGRDFEVTPAVLIPRPETELVVAAALEKLAPGQMARAADAGAGSGAIAVTLALERPAARVAALDRSAAALAVARRNAARWGARVAFVVADWLAPVRGETLDLIVANPPYVADDELASLAREVRDYEPRAALVSGPTGLEAYEKLVPQAALALRPGGWLILEIGYRAGDGVRALLGRWRDVETRRDWQGWERVVVARRG
ncbi:MAG TPA: peptide chain release factor N(5)-glutamine methyltransferase [Terriglobales bacterium]|nr:peptide chain release factor N(5)-glutamine methyltransferase [Terriglobales bacterium]